MKNGEMSKYFKRDINLDVRTLEGKKRFMVNKLIFMTRENEKFYGKYFLIACKLTLDNF